jgi:transposase
MKIDPNDLPRNLEQCHALIAELTQELDVRQRRLRQLQHQLEQLLRWRYGPRRERVDENQLFLFATELVAAEPEQPEKADTESPPKERSKRKGHGRKRLPAHLERKRVEYDLSEEQKCCPDCQTPLVALGEEVSERLEYVPASLFVIEEVVKKYACRNGCTVLTAQKPSQPIEKGLPGPGLLAHVAVSKYGDHLPLNRQEDIFSRCGVELSRQTMCDWMGRSAELLSPLYELMTRCTLASKVVQTDDSPVGVLDPELPRTRTGRIWTYVGDQEHPYTVYDYTESRSRDGPERFLQAFQGFLQADAYAGYDRLFADPDRDVNELSCWAHARRKYYDCQSSDLMRSMVMLAYVRLLYDVEREAKQRGLDSAARQALRQEKSIPVLNDIKDYLERQLPQVLPKSPIADAIGYVLGNWEALIRYCEDGDLEIDNNGAERALRPFAIGRKNWMFFGSNKGGTTAAILTSFVASCKRLHIDPFAYLRDVFERISSHPIHRLHELLPDQWEAARKAQTPPTN